MCFNEYVSFGTFIVGTIFNIILYTKFKTKNILCVSIIWQWVLLMQFFEGLIWISKNDKMNKICSYCAYLANILQPVVTFMCIMLLTSQPLYSKIIAIIVISFYSIYMIYKYADYVKDTLTTTSTKTNCKHLNYEWWQNDSGIVYIVCLLLIMAVMTPHKTFLFQFAIIALTLLMASITQLNCGVASTWCFLAASAPILTLVYHSIVGVD
jgi:hypothetical protein